MGSKFMRLCAAILTLICLIDDAYGSPPELSSKQMREDLAYLRDVWAIRERSLDAPARQSFEHIVADAMQRVDSLTPADFALEVSRALSVANNMHSMSTLGPYFRGLPIEAAWFADGLYIVRAHRRFALLLGARIDRFGSLTAEHALARVTPFISGIDAYVRAISPDYLRLYEVLERIGAVERHGAVDLTVTLTTGERRIVTLSKRDASESGSPTNRSVVLNPQSAWQHVLDNVRQPPAIYRQRQGVTAERLGGPQRILYVICSDLSNETSGTATSTRLANIVVRDIRERRPRHVIVDLRMNAGGNFMNAFLFAHVLPRLLPSDGKVFVLIGPRTLSAAIATAALLKARGRDRVVLVGEPLGDRPQFWADSEQLVLPHSKLRVTASREYEDWENGCDDLDRCLWLNVALGESDVSLEPEIRVTTTFADYAAGRDPVLEAVLIQLQPSG